MWQGEFAIDGQVIGFEALVDPKPISELLDVKGELMFRTVYPTVAQEQSCVWRVLHKEAGPLPGQIRRAAMPGHRVAASCLADIELGRYETQKHRNESSSCVTEEGHASLFL
jgi:hypothetical protein